jgi:hypothetical protein
MSARAVLALLCGLALAAVPALAGATSTRVHIAKAPHVRFACSGKGAAKRPCRFSTPSNDIHCQWLPSTGAVTCELLAGGSGYVLAPAGKARKVRASLPRRGETLPTVQQLVFPHGLSCQDTRMTITCNQDFASGAFKLAPKRP